MLDEVGAEGVVVGAVVEADTYGRPDNAVTLTENDDCESGGEYASFVVTSHSMTCTNSETGDESAMTMDNGSGAWRENPETNQTEIYGSFDISAEDESITGLLCSFAISHDEMGGG